MFGLEHRTILDEVIRYKFISMILFFIIEVEMYQLILFQKPNKKLRNDVTMDYLFP